MNVLDPGVALATLALAIAVAAGAGVLWVALSTRPRRVRPGPTTMELRDETPALVDMLTGGFEVDDDAVPATAIDLARRGHFDLEDYGGNVVIRLRTTDGDTLTAYEERIARHVRNHASTDGTAPAAALTIGPDGVSARWYRGFVREVTRHGRKLGLCRRRFDLSHLAIAWLLVAAAIAPAWIVVAVSDRTDDPTTWGSIGNIVLGLALLCGLGVLLLAGKLTRTDTQADTPAGREAAAHWLGVRDAYRSNDSFETAPAAAVAIWERHLAYATAMGLAPEVQRQLPFETEHDRHAWSRATGRWRRVKVRYQSFRPGWGEHPGRVAFGGVIQAAVYGAVSYLALTAARSETQLDALDGDQRRWVGLAAAIITVVAGLAALYALVKVVIGVADLFPRRTIEGEVVRNRTYRRGHRLPKVLQWAIWSGRDQHGFERDQSRRTLHHLAVDDGSDDQILAYEVRNSIRRDAPQGSRVRIRVSPLLGYVSEIELLTPPTRSAANEPGVPHALVDDTLAAAGTGLADGLGEVLARSGDITDDEGRPILEQKDEDGVTLAERLREGGEQLDRLRNDPRVASSPLAGLLDAFAGARDARPSDRTASSDESGESSDTGDTGN